MVSSSAGQQSPTERQRGGSFKGSCRACFTGLLSMYEASGLGFGAGFEGLRIFGFRSACHFWPLALDLQIKTSGPLIQAYIFFVKYLYTYQFLCKHIQMIQRRVFIQTL